MKKSNESFLRYFNRTELKKYINYCFFNQYFDQQTTVKKINTLNSEVIIFTVIVPSGKMLFPSSQSDFRFQDCKIDKKGRMVATFGCSIYYNKKALKSILNQINFFRRFPKDAKKLNFPDLNLKNDISEDMIY